MQVLGKGCCKWIWWLMVIVWEAQFLKITFSTINRQIHIHNGQALLPICSRNICKLIPPCEMEIRRLVLSVSSLMERFCLNCVNKSSRKCKHCKEIKMNWLTVATCHRFLICFEVLWFYLKFKLLYYGYYKLLRISIRKLKGM